MRLQLYYGTGSSLIANNMLCSPTRGTSLQAAETQWKDLGEPKEEEGSRSLTVEA